MPKTRIQNKIGKVNTEETGAEMEKLYVVPDEVGDQWDLAEFCLCDVGGSKTDLIWDWTLLWKSAYNSLLKCLPLLENKNHFISEMCVTGLKFIVALEQSVGNVFTG